MEKNARGSRNTSQPHKDTFSGSTVVQDIIAAHVQEGAALRQNFFATNAHVLRQAALRMAQALARGNKILLCGNGGSAADAQHIAGELVNRFLLDRPPLPAVALTTDTSVLTAIGNDFGFDQIFCKQVRALGQPGDVLLGISTSGSSPNVLAALREARQRGMLTLGLCGASKTAENASMQDICDLLLCVGSASTPLVQEVHITVGHLLCRLIDYYLFENAAELELTA